MNILILNFLRFLLHLPRKNFSSLRSCRCRSPLCQLLPVWSGLAKGISSGNFIKMYIFFSLLLYFTAVSLCSHHFSFEYTYESPSQQLRSAGLESRPSKTRGRNMGANLSHIKWQFLHNSFTFWGTPEKMQNLSFDLLQHSQQGRKIFTYSSLGSCETWGPFDNLKYLYAELNARALKSGMEDYMGRICSSLEEDRFWLR